MNIAANYDNGFGSGEVAGFFPMRTPLSGDTLISVIDGVLFI